MLRLEHTVSVVLSTIYNRTGQSLFGSRGDSDLHCDFAGKTPLSNASSASFLHVVYMASHAPALHQAERGTRPRSPMALTALRPAVRKSCDIRCGAGAGAAR